MKNVLIALSGKAGSGKTEAMKILNDIAHDDGWSLINFPVAAPLKEIAQKYFGWNGDKEIYYPEIDPSIPKDSVLYQLKNCNREPIPDKGRQLLINIGDKFREIRSTIWADLVLESILKLDSLNNSGCIFCVDDMRYKNEMDALKRFERVLFVRISRPIGQLDIVTPSERNLDEVVFDVQIENTGTLEEYREKIKGLYSQIKNIHS